jgi:hypothetical protein
LKLLLAPRLSRQGESGAGGFTLSQEFLTMLVKFTRNLGSHDATRLNLSHKDCTINAQIEVSEETASRLLSRGLATEVKSEVKAVAQSPIVKGIKGAKTDE